MKRILLFFLLFSFIRSYGQTCGYYPPTVGGVFEMQTFDDKGKLRMTNTAVVKAIDGNKATIDSKVIDDKNKNIAAMTFDVVCKDGNLYVDGGGMVPISMFEGKKDASVSVTGDKVVYPENLSATSALPDATIQMKMEMQGMPFPMNSTIKIQNRKVEGQEDVTVPAGTFKCWKISYDLEYKILVNFHGKAIEWICPGKGFIKSESYNKNGKLAGSSVRTK